MRVHYGPHEEQQLECERLILNGGQIQYAKEGATHLLGNLRDGQWQLSPEVPWRSGAQSSDLIAVSARGPLALRAAQSLVEPLYAAYLRSYPARAELRRSEGPVSDNLSLGRVLAVYENDAPAWRVGHEDVSWLVLAEASDLASAHFAAPGVLLRPSALAERRRA